MNNREEQLRRVKNDGQDSPPTIARRTFLKRFSREEYENEQRVKRADIQSVDRVQSRLAEHIAMNSSVYWNNRSLQRDQIHQPFSQTDQSLHQRKRREQHGLLSRLGTIATTLVLLLVVGSFFAVLHTEHSTNVAGTASGQDHNITTTSISSAVAVSPSISIVQSVETKKFQFFQVKTVVAVKEAIVLFNKTSIFQTVNTDDNQTLSLKPYDGTGQLSFSQSGFRTLSLASNTTTHTSITVFDTRVTIEPSHTGEPMLLQSTQLAQQRAIPITLPLVWLNETEQVQVVLSKSQNCVSTRIPPHQQYYILCPISGLHTFYLQSSPTVQITINLVGQ